MSQTMSSGMQASMGDVKVNSSKSAKASGVIDLSSAIPAAKAGTLTVRTNNTDGSLTMAPGHGIVTADKATIFWPGGIRYNVTIGTVAGDVVPFVGATGGGGDNLPPAAAAVTVAVMNLAPANIQNLLTRGLLIGAPLPFAVIFYAVNVLNGVSFSRDAPGDSYIYDASTGYPFAGPSADNIALAHGDATKAQLITCKILTD